MVGEYLHREVRDVCVDEVSLVEAVHLSAIDGDELPGVGIGGV
jgi:hypothetical protein